jgi:dCTP deaminase
VDTPRAANESGLLTDRELVRELGRALQSAAGSPPIAPEQVQAASVDLRLSARAFELSAGFLPGAATIAQRLAELSSRQISLERPSLLHGGKVYLIELEEALCLPPDLSASFNPRSSAGRCDLFARVLADGHPRFNEAPPLWRGRLWLELAPLSFDVVLGRGDRLVQVRLERGRARLSAEEVARIHSRTPLVHGDGGPLDLRQLALDEDGGLALRLGLAGRQPCGWRARPSGGVLEFTKTGAHAMADFWEPVQHHAGHLVLAPGAFYLFASSERLAIPPELSAEMVPVDLGLGELRNNYAGFFDPGFGCGRGGTCAVLEVRVRDVPFLVEDGQTFFRLRFYRNLGRPMRAYAEGRTGPSYQDQGLSPARCFRAAP